MIRPATPEDLPRLLELGRAFFVESDYGRLTGWNDAAAAAYVAAMVAGPDTVILVAEWRGAVVGGLAGVVAALPWSPGCRVATETQWFMDSAARGAAAGYAALGLIIEFERWAADRGAALVAMSEIEGLSGGTLGRLYAKRGYAPTERTYLKRVA